MSLEELKEKAAELTEQERLELISAIAQSMKNSRFSESPIKEGEWQFLAPRAESWRKQLYIKGSRLPASVIWSAYFVNNMTLEETAADWNLPIAVVQEALKYCELNRELIKSEAERERKCLDESESGKKSKQLAEQAKKSKQLAEQAKKGASLELASAN